MKRLELKGGRKLMLLLVLLIAGLGTYAQPVISGTIKDVDSQYVLNQVVEITTDTIGVSYPYYAADTVDANGFYSITLPQNLPIGIHFIVKTMSCGQPVTQTILYPYSSTTNFTICPVNRYLRGHVIKGGMPADLAMVYLIRREYDSTSNSYTAELTDTAYTDANGSFIFLLPVSSTDSYLVRAALLPTDTADFINFIPSYFMGDVRWTNANVLANANAQIDLVLQPAMNMQGQGYIAGQVSDSTVRRVLILTTDNDVPVAYRYSNTSGGFSFGALDYGSYKLFGDVLGKSNPFLAFSLSANNPSIGTIVFHETSTSFYGSLFPLGVGALGRVAEPTIYPNPVADYLHIQGLNKIGGDKNITLTTISGAVVYTKTVNNNDEILVPFSELASGFYFLQINSAAGKSSLKIVK